MDLRRPSLLWLRAEEICRVNAKLLALCLEPGQFIEVASCDPWVPKVKIFPYSFVRFEWQVIGERYPVMAWLKVEGKPRWDYHWKNIHDTSFIDKVPFKDIRCRPVADLIKAYVKHFPFVPTNNYFTHNGDLIA